MQWSPKHWNLTSTRHHFGPSQPGDAFAFWHQKGPMFLAGWNHHSSSSFRIQPWTINGFVQGKIQVFVFSQHLPLTVNIGCDSQPIHLVTYCNHLQIVCTIEQNHCRRGFYAMGFPFGYPWVESPGLSNLRNLYQHKPHEWTYSVLSEHYGKTSQILWKWSENAPNPVKIMGKRPKTPWFVISLHMSYEKKWLLQWLLKHGLEATIKDPGRNPCSFYAEQRVKVWMDGVWYGHPIMIRDSL